MGEIISAIEGAVSGFLSNPIVQLTGRAIVIYLVLLWLASAYWAYRDLQSRTANPIAPYLAAVFIILFTPFLFVFGVLLYRLIRPQDTVEEANERALAQEAMLREMQTQHCQTCGRRVEPDWLICPYCRGRLRTLCPACDRVYELDWAVCAWCGIDPRALGRPAVVGPAAQPAIGPMARPALQPMAQPAALAEVAPGGAQAREPVVAAATTSVAASAGGVTDATAVIATPASPPPPAAPGEPSAEAAAERRATRRRRSDRDLGTASDSAPAAPRPVGAEAAPGSGRSADG